jgi:cytochrome P450
MPAFHRRHLEGYAEHMSRYSQAHAAGWRDGAVVDAAAEMMRLTRAIVARTLFDVELASDSAESAEIDRALGRLVGSFGAPGALLLPLVLVERGWLPGTRGLPEAREVLDRLVYRLIEERRATGEDRGDLLSLLVHAVDAEGDGEGMSDQQVRDEVMTLFLAGHETTANALAWTWQLLGDHPEVEASLHAELDRVLGGRRPTMADLEKLVFTRQVLTESMRLYPPAWIIGRRALVDYRLGDFGIPRGATLLMSQYVVHRDARWFEAPARFRPSRWAEAPPADRPKYAYFPFGGGPRRCIGEAFAWMEGILILATLAQGWRLRPLPGHPVVPDPLITLRPRHGIRVSLEARG